MDLQTLYTILIIVGTFLSIGMGVNAFFLKGIYDRLGTVEIGQATIFAQGRSREKRIEHLEQENKEIFGRLNLIEREVLKWAMQQKMI